MMLMMQKVVFFCFFFQWIVEILFLRGRHGLLDDNILYVPESAGLGGNSLLCAEQGRLKTG